MKITTILKSCCIVVPAVLFSCQSKKDPESTMKSPAIKDVHSYAEPDKARVTHLNWKATVNF
ncbi:MAG TPA: hypothetical protein VGK59_13600 [Ohtaekwangia sp.]